jgi:15-cis-phytoene synthase
MSEPPNDLLPPQRLAIAYAPPNVRHAFSLLLQFDARLGDIVAKTSETLIGQMKLAWWRDAISVEPDNRPKGEPLIGLLSRVGDPDIHPELLMLVDAWETLLVGEAGPDALAAFGKARGAAVFGGYARWVGSQVDVDALGHAWAIAAVTKDIVRRPALPRKRLLRPLTILALSVRDVSGPRLLWHALTGR